MPSTTNSSFSGTTEALDVATVFPSQIRGKTILVTGVNLKGIGFTTAEAFASQSPARIIIASRSIAKINESIDALISKYPAVEYRSLQLDLSSQAKVRAAATEVLSWSDVPAINIVVNSAGIMNLPERTLSEDGIEMHFATNHIGHFLFTNLVMEKLVAATDSSAKGATRVVNVSSLSPTWNQSVRWSDVNFDKVNKTLPKEEQPAYEVMKAWGMENPEEASYLPLAGYDQSKTANLLFSVGLTKKLYEKHGILSLAVHPGVIGTELGRNTDEKIKAALAELLPKSGLQIKTLGGGASTSLVAALDPNLGLGVGETKDGKENHGLYLADCQISEAALPLAISGAQAEKLWERSEELVGQKFAF